MTMSEENEPKHKCIICSKPVNCDGYIGTKKGISVSFCEEHAKDCTGNCEKCSHSKLCSVCGK